MSVAMQSNKKVVYACRYQVVWCPKYRRPVLVDDVRRRLVEILREEARDRHAVVIALEVLSDHVSLVVDADPQFGIHRLVKRLKARSSHDLRREFPHLRSRLPALWTHSYFVVTIGGARTAAVRRYVVAQRHT
jgi:putative transposase